MNADPLLWSLDEAARQLGGVSVRTVQRLIQRRELPAVSVGRRRLVRPADVRALIARSSTPSATLSDDNASESTEQQCPEEASKTATGSFAARTRRTGGSRSRTDAAAQLAAVLGFPTPKTRKG
ncbi:helix-turn-helix domain-containing protein [uncultured Thiohalocapsa sp.]|uniref:helix-turn-helix domain-containing protein n=1 Tax=uncultured Thiohalocapsa sp. TaxID=768990 RepID=UPI00345876A9